MEERVLSGRRAAIGLDAAPEEVVIPSLGSIVEQLGVSGLEGLHYQGLQWGLEFGGLEHLVEFEPLHFDYLKDFVE